MKNTAALLKELRQIGNALNEIVAPQLIVRVIDEDPELVLDRMIAAGEITTNQRDDVLIIRRLIVYRTRDSDGQSPNAEDKYNDIQAVN